MRIRRQEPSPSVAIESLCYQVKVPEGEPQNILEEIVWYKEQEVEKMRDRLSLLDLRVQVKKLTNQPKDFFRSAS